MSHLATYPQAARPSPVRRRSIAHQPFWQNMALLFVLIVLLTLFEGAARKWLFPSYAWLRYLAYFSKDIVFVLAAYVGLRRARRFDLSWVLLCALLILVPSAVSTMSHSNVVGMGLSFRAYLLIPLCAFCAAPLIRNFRDIERCAIVVAGACVMIAALGVYQYSLPTSHILNRYDTGMGEGHIVANAGHVRATGTFAYIGGMAIMAGFGAWAGMFLVFPIAGRPSWVRLVGAAAVAAALMCASVAMSRSALMFWGVTVAGGLFLYLRANQLLILGLAVFAVGAALGSANAFEDMDVLGKQDSVTTGMIYRMQHADSFSDRAAFVVTNLAFGLTNHPLGEGLGVGQPGGHYAVFGERNVQSYESEWGRIAYEVGPPGLIGVLIIRLIAGLICWRALLQTTDNHRRLVLATALPFFGTMSLGWMAFNHVGSSAAWVVMAFALAAVRPDRREKSA
jgi:hypothetical protein